ncbi:MAG: ScpA family protein [Arenicellales bacterium]|nr:ScpA family protein [Arenicellales bacterium]
MIALSQQERGVVIEGKHFDEWPDDLYIPPEALKIFLETFEGPLDLLLFLIRRQNLDILDIPVSEIVRQYVHYVEVMQTLELDLAGEYLVMAATLAEIKSRMLIPRQGEGGEGEGEGEDPRALLVQRLQEYERFREAALSVEDRPRVGRELFLASTELNDPSPVKIAPKVDFEQLIDAFRGVVMRSEANRHWTFGQEMLSVRERMSQVLERTQSSDFVRFETLFEESEGRMGLVITFVAILELVKDRTLSIVQNEPYASIHVKGNQLR